MYFVFFHIFFNLYRCILYFDKLFMDCEQLFVLPPEILRPPEKNVYGM